jgi:uncharacterized protein YndB with AHSA1/START domain
MKTPEKTLITVATKINAPVERVWKMWTEPQHIIRWNYASDDWHTLRAENDLRIGGKFLSRMEAKDGSIGFDFTGEYTRIELYRSIESTLGDNRKVKITFASKGKATEVSETFESEPTHTIEQQHSGWQSILVNFRKYCELKGKSEILHFEVMISRNPETVFNTMLDEGRYKEWTSEFNPSSHFKGSWKKGSKILFIGTDSNGSTGGMVSRIKDNIPGRYLSIEHLGIIKDGKEITDGPDIEEWAGALENYTFTNKNGSTLLQVDLDSNQEFKSYFIETWPKALKKLKSMCEHQQ